MNSKNLTVFTNLTHQELFKELHAAVFDCNTDYIKKFEHTIHTESNSDGWEQRILVDFEFDNTAGTPWCTVELVVKNVLDKATVTSFVLILGDIKDYIGTEYFEWRSYDWVTSHNKTINTDIPDDDQELKAFKEKQVTIVPVLMVCEKIIEQIRHRKDL